MKIIQANKYKRQILLVVLLLLNLPWLILELAIIPPKMLLFFKSRLLL
ncbi:unnamed protein product [Paramecium sonneborni]|uniref:Uncharacterized protein n=1 Tax=Paramecium sonneborni TaxID=65129 RepID=A0A8S1PRL7_9CILI|nr:unnamed protein product [Paramecium sonneborni]